MLIAVQIVTEAIEKIRHPVIPDFGAETVAVLIITLLINIVICRYEYRQGQKLNSVILMSDSLHTKSDIYVSLGVLFTLIGIKLGAPAIIDPIASLVVGGFIVHAAKEIIKSTSDVLVDKAAIDLELIQAVTTSFPEVKDVHDIRSRGSEFAPFVDMHIEIDPTMSIEASHDLVHAIEAKLKQEINPHLQVLIHTEPYKVGLDSDGV